jgi:hypothetical protein
VHFEVFATPQMCARAWPGLARAAAQCTAPKARVPRVNRTELRRILRDAAAAKFEQAPEVGAGELRREFGSALATVLSQGGRLVHASLFAA